MADGAADGHECAAQFGEGTRGRLLSLIDLCGDAAEDDDDGTFSGNRYVL